VLTALATQWQCLTNYPLIRKMQQNSVISAITSLVTADLEQNCCKTFADSCNATARSQYYISIRKMQQNSIISAITSLVTANLELNCCKTFAKGNKVL